MKSWLKENIPNNQPTVITGDLNMGAGVFKDSSWLLFQNLFNDFSPFDPDDTVARTFPSESFLKLKSKFHGKPDHIITSNHIKNSNARIAFQEKFRSKNGDLLNFSDHYAWETEIKIP